MHISSLLKLAALVFSAVTCVVIGDTAGKILSGRGVDPVFIAWTRFGLAVGILLPFSRLSRADLAQFRDWRILLRGGVIAGGICCILTALRTEPIANVFGAFFVGPIVSYLLAVIFMGETPSRSRSLFLGLGFIGVLLVVKPGFGASWGMALALVAGALYGAYLALTRAVAGRYRPGFLLISQLIVGAIILTPPGLGVDASGLSLSLWALIALSALASALGNFLLVLANRSAEAGVIAPLVYTQLFSATLAGGMVFGDWPDRYALLGLVLIGVSGGGSILSHQLAARRLSASRSA